MANNNDFVLGTSTTDTKADSVRSDHRETGGRFSAGGSNIIEGARSRPVIAAAAVTAVAAAGAYLWSKRSSASSQPLMRWGQDGSQSSGYDSAKATSTFDQQAQSSFDSAYAPETAIASASPSSGAGISSGISGESSSSTKLSIDNGSSSMSGGPAGGTTIDSDLGSVGAQVGAAGGSNPAGTSSNTGSQSTDTAGSGLDDVSKTDTKTGSIAYGA